MCFVVRDREEAVCVNSAIEIEGLVDLYLSAPLLAQTAQIRDLITMARSQAPTRLSNPERTANIETYKSINQ